MLRVAVGPEVDGYAIPPGNLEGEVWAYGLRNPWRWAFDGGDLWIGDVGQNRIEEVNVVDWSAGNPNFGWPIMEGTECFERSECDRSGLVLPLYEYPHSEGCSVTGGVVYRGSAMPELAGHFLFADYCSGWVRSVDKNGDVREWLPAGNLSAVTSFGVGPDGEAYVLSATGTVYRLERAA
jgi:glucose/arabinose dehydrogenase